MCPKRTKAKHPRAATPLPTHRNPLPEEETEESPIASTSTSSQNPPPPLPTAPPPPPPHSAGMCACERRGSGQSSSASSSSGGSATSADAPPCPPPHRHLHEMHEFCPELCLTLPMVLGMREAMADLHTCRHGEEKRNALLMENMRTRKEKEIRRQFRRMLRDERRIYEQRTCQSWRDRSATQKTGNNAMDDFTTPLDYNSRKFDDCIWYQAPLLLNEAGTDELPQHDRDILFLADTFLISLGRQLTLNVAPQRELYCKCEDRVELEGLANEVLRNFSDTYLAARDEILSWLEDTSNEDKLSGMQKTFAATAIAKFLIYQILECREIMMLEKVGIPALGVHFAGNTIRDKRINKALASQELKGRTTCTVNWLFRCLTELKTIDILGYQFMMKLLLSYRGNNGMILERMRNSVESVWNGRKYEVETATVEIKLGNLGKEKDGVDCKAKDQSGPSKINEG